MLAPTGGMFLARRFQTEAWPVLQRLLATGTAHTPGLLSLGTDAARPGGGGGGGAQRQRLALEPGSGSGGGSAVALVVGGEDAGGALAPAAVVRVQVAALGCLEAVCRCRDATAAVRTLTWNIAQVGGGGCKYQPKLNRTQRIPRCCADSCCNAGVCCGMLRRPGGVALASYPTCCVPYETAPTCCDPTRTRRPCYPSWPPAPLRPWRRPPAAP